MVSVVVPFRNAAAFLGEAVQGVIDQTYEDWELLLVDDGSSDEGPEIAREFQRLDQRIICVRATEDRLGISATRNVGLRLSRGEIVALLDSDDVWFPQKLEQQVELLEANPDVELLYGRSEYWHSWAAGSEGSDYTPALGTDPWQVIEPPELLLRLYPLGPGNAPAVSSIVFRRSLADRIGGFEESISDAYDDQGFLVKAYLAARVLVADCLWDRYRQHSDSVSAQTEQAGSYWNKRLLFLRWLRRYVAEQSRTDERVEAALEAALFLCGDDDARPTPVAEVDRVTVERTSALAGVNLELPAVGRLVVRDLPVAGWVLGRSTPATRVCAEQGGKRVASIPVNRSRADIGAAFQGHGESAASCGFEGAVDSFLLSPGVLHVNALLADGEVACMGTIVLR